MLYEGMRRSEYPTPEVKPIPGVRGRLERFRAFPSRYVQPHRVDVWLPEAYQRDPQRRFPVIYMQDGQNLFVPEWSFAGVDWGLDEAIERLAASEGIGPAIVVGIWNTPARVMEYMPARPMALDPKGIHLKRFIERFGEAPISDAYLKFMVYELKPFIDAVYRTRPEHTFTFAMGSSMGALLSLYALCEYPEVFGGVACLSTSWTVSGRLFIPYLRMTFPQASGHRVYFDYGVEALIGRYESYQRQVNRMLMRKGYVQDDTWMTRRFAGAEHSERAWRERVEIPLRFLLRAVSGNKGANSPEGKNT